MKGDHIYILREKNILTYQHPYQHHGIDCGDGYVIHFSRTRNIVRDTMSYFMSKSKDGIVYTYNHRPEECDSPSVVIHRAKSRLGKGGYNLVSNNCEHFASWCKTGHKKSKQINGVVGNLGGTGTAAAIGTALATIPATTVAAPGIMGVLGMTAAAPVLAIGAVPAAAIFGGAFLAGTIISHHKE